MTEAILDDVSDTALWVAVYRERETERADALFRDPLAGRLAGARGKRIETRMSDSRYVQWSVVIRTCIIDRYIQNLVSSEGVDTVINLGAGLDTRPYRLPLPAGLRWVEVDFPKIVALKEGQLADQQPRCKLERIGLDLSNEPARRELFSRLGAESGKALVLTEGVTPYLSNEAVASLAADLRRQPHFRYWITDYNSPELVKRLTSARRRREMKNAPFLFNPPDWTAFYESLGWRKREMRYIGEEAERLGRPAPHPQLLKLLLAVISTRKMRETFQRMNGYAVLEPR